MQLEFTCVAADRYSVKKSHLPKARSDQRAMAGRGEMGGSSPSVLVSTSSGRLRKVVTLWMVAAAAIQPVLLSAQPLERPSWWNDSQRSSRHHGDIHRLLPLRRARPPSFDMKSSGGGVQWREPEQFLDDPSVAKTLLGISVDEGLQDVEEDNSQQVFGSTGEEETDATLDEMAHIDPSMRNKLLPSLERISAGSRATVESRGRGGGLRRGTEGRLEWSPSFESLPSPRRRRGDSGVEVASLEEEMSQRGMWPAYQRDSTAGVAASDGDSSLATALELLSRPVLEKVFLLVMKLKQAAMARHESEASLVR